MSPHNPIIEQNDFSNVSLFTSRPSLKPGVALVLYRDDGKLITLSQGQHISFTDKAFKKYKWYYKVDTALHSFNFKIDLPCNKGAFNFHASVQINYQVTDPEEIIRQQITDIHSLLQPEIIDRMRKISRKYELNENEEAEQAINQAFEKGVLIHGISVNRVMTILELEDESRQHFRTMQDIDHKIALRTKEHELNQKLDDFDVERKEKRMKFYAPIIRDGQWQLLALNLTEHPEDVTTISQMIYQHNQVDFQNQLSTLKVLLEEDALEAFQVEEVGKRVLQRLVDHFGQMKALAEGSPIKVSSKEISTSNENIENTIEIIDSEDVEVFEPMEKPLENSIKIEEETGNDE